MKLIFIIALLVQATLITCDAVQDGGLYIITPKGSPGKAFGIEGASPNDGAQVIAEPLTCDDSQKFTLKQYDANSFTVVVKSTGKVLTANGASASDFSYLYQRDENHAVYYQEISFVPGPDGYYYIQMEPSNTEDYTLNNDGHTLTFEPVTGADNQLFWLQATTTTTGQCSDCVAPQVYLAATKTCGTCTAPQVYNPSTFACEDCVAPQEYLAATQSCGTCTAPQVYNPNTYACEDCQAPTVYNSQTQSCEACVAPQEYLAATKTCGTCSAPQVYNPNTYACENCVAPAVYLAATQTCGTCTAPQVYNPSTYACEDCQAPTVYNPQTQTCEGCQAPKVYNSQTKSCEDCVSPAVYLAATQSCGTCSAPQVYNPSDYACENCPASDYYNFDGTCIPECECPNYLRDSQGGFPICKFPCTKTQIYQPVTNKCKCTCSSPFTQETVNGYQICAL